MTINSVCSYLPKQPSKKSINQDQEFLWSTASCNEGVCGSKKLCFPHQMSNSGDDSCHTSGNNHGIVLAIVVVVIIIIIAVASYVCSRAFCSVQYHCCEPGHGNNSLRGQSSDNLQLAEDGLINSERSRRKANQDTSRSCCSICLVDYRKDDELRSLPDCNHLFHRECIDPWLRLHPTCPICRKPPLPTPELTPLVLTEAAPFRSVISAP